MDEHLGDPDYIEALDSYPAKQEDLPPSPNRGLTALRDFVNEARENKEELDNCEKLLKLCEERLFRADLANDLCKASWHIQVEELQEQVRAYRLRALAAEEKLDKIRAAMD